MTLIVEDGSGLSNSESYTDVAFANAYVKSFIPSDVTWKNKGLTTKEDALKVGALFIDNKYRQQWQGRRRFETQALAFPRINVVDADHFVIDDDVIPLNLKRATVEVAIRFINSTQLEPDAVADSIGVESVLQKFDVFTQDITYVGARSTQPIFIKIDRLLCEYLLGQGQGFVERG